MHWDHFVCFCNLTYSLCLFTHRVFTRAHLCQLLCQALGMRGLLLTPVTTLRKGVAWLLRFQTCESHLIFRVDLGIREGEDEV